MSGLEAFGAVAAASQLPATIAQVMEYMQNIREFQDANLINEKVQHLVQTMEAFKASGLLDTHEANVQLAEIHQGARKIQDDLAVLCNTGRAQRALKLLSGKPARIRRNVDDLEPKKTTLTLCILGEILNTKNATSERCSKIESTLKVLQSTVQDPKVLSMMQQAEEHLSTLTQEYHAYHKVSASNNALQLNGDGGQRDKDGGRGNKYERVEALDRAKQWNGNANDPSLARMFFQSPNK